MKHIVDEILPGRLIVLLDTGEAMLRQVRDYGEDAVVYSPQSILRDHDGHTLATLYRLTSYQRPVTHDAELLAVFGDPEAYLSRCWHPYTKLAVLQAPDTIRSDLRCIVQRTDKGASFPKVEWARRVGEWI